MYLLDDAQASTLHIHSCLNHVLSIKKRLNTANRPFYMIRELHSQQVHTLQSMSILNASSTRETCVKPNADCLNETTL